MAALKPQPGVALDYDRRRLLTLSSSFHFPLQVKYLKDFRILFLHGFEKTKNDYGLDRQ